MSATIFTLSSTSRRVVPAPNSPPLPIHIKATNVIFNPNIPAVNQNLGIEEFVYFLSSCRLRYAISDVPSQFFPSQVCEFYYTAAVNDQHSVITGTIGRGRHSVSITPDLLRTALRLPTYESFSDLPSIERCRQLFDRLGYDHSRAGTRDALILRQCMTAGWKFLTGALIRCIGHKSRSHDQLSSFEQLVVCSLLLNKRIDYAALFFDQFVQCLLANVRADHVPFPRWIALVLDLFYAEQYYSHAGDPIPYPRMSVRMYQDNPLANDIGLSDRMREWIANPYVAELPLADTDAENEEEDADNNDNDAEQQNEQNQDHFSPQLSPHNIPSDHGEQSDQRMPTPQGEHPSQGEQHQGTQLITIPASALHDLITLTHDMSQCLERIEADVAQLKADVTQLKGVLLPTPSASFHDIPPPSPPPGPNDDIQKGGENTEGGGDNEGGGAGDKGDKEDKNQETEGDTEKQPDPTESDAEGSEPQDEDFDEECHMLDMTFIDPIIPVQGEDSGELSDDQAPLSRKRKSADTSIISTGPDAEPSSSEPPKKKGKILLNLNQVLAEWGCSPEEVTSFLEEHNQVQRNKKRAKADEKLIRQKLQSMGSFENQLALFNQRQAQASARPSVPPPKPHTENALDRLDRKRFLNVFERRVSADKIIKLRTSKPRAEKILTLMITRQGSHHQYTEVIKRDELIRYGFTEWMELHELASKQTSALSSELTCALNLLIKKVQRLDLVPKERPQQQAQPSSVPRIRRQRFHAEDEDILVLNFGADEINNSLPVGVEPVQHQFIQAPENGLFYLDRNRRMCFQRTLEIPRAPTKHLVGLRQMCMGHRDLSGEFHILIAMELLNRREELLNSPFWPVKIEAEAEYEEFLSRERQE